MLFVNWFIGPQMLGIIFLIAGLLQKRFPPKHINSFYGYRTTRSMKDQQNWDEGNRFSTRLMLKAAWIMIIGGLIITTILQQITITDTKKMLIKVILMLGAAFATVIIMFTSTEKHLQKLFDHKQ